MYYQEQDVGSTQETWGHVNPASLSKQRAGKPEEVSPGLEQQNSALPDGVFLEVWFTVAVLPFSALTAFRGLCAFCVSARKNESSHGQPWFLTCE